VPATQIIVNHVFHAPTSGTGPFEFGLKLDSKTDTPTTDPSDMLDIFNSAWTDNLRGHVWSGIGTGVVELTFINSDGEDLTSLALANATGSHQPTLAGAAFRIRFVANRPRGGRANACYVPMPDQSDWNADGVVQTGAATDCKSWGDQIISALDDTDYVWNAYHQVGGKTSPIVKAPVSTVSVANTVSFLRRRYR
jgi:hypothetical protein